MNDNLREMGIGNVLVSRKLVDDQVIFVAFLVDIYCLGIKDVMIKSASRLRYDKEVVGPRKKDGIERLRPACAVKLLEGAAAYAAELRLPPHRDYRKALKIFGDVDPSDADDDDYEY